MPPRGGPRSPFRGSRRSQRDRRLLVKVGAQSLTTDRPNDRRAEVDLLQCSRVASYEVLGGCRMAQGREIEEGSSVALRRHTSSRGARRGGYSPLPVTARPRSLALGSRTAALQRAVARPFWPRATARSGPVEGEVTASARGATARFPRQMHGRLGARLEGHSSEPDPRGSSPPPVDLSPSFRPSRCRGPCGRNEGLRSTWLKHLTD
jgi:hypothetical protein